MLRNGSALSLVASSTLTLKEYKSTAEKSSGIISLENVLGEGWMLCVVQAHYNIGDPELVEGGQLVLIHFPPGQEK